jgi:tRNA uridine 5-carboxymethylaminomethyl modification enzyme
MMVLTEKIRKRDELINFCENLSIKPELINEKLLELGTTVLRQTCKLKDIILRPQVSFKDLRSDLLTLDELISGFGEAELEIMEAAEIVLKYTGYIEREKLIANKIKRLEEVRISSDFDFKKLKSLSTEARQKLTKIKPSTIGQATRISGISPSDINVLLVYLGR